MRAFFYNPPLARFNLVSSLWLSPCVILGVSLFLGFTRESGKLKPLSMAVILIIMLNWLLHSFWGNELFLFSPHWHFAAVVGFISLVRFLPTGRATDILIVLLSTSLVVLNFGVCYCIISSQLCLATSGLADNQRLFCPDWLSDVPHHRV
jgi:hypothetical protein